MTQKTGLKERIRSAESAEEIEELMAEGGRYQSASIKTQKQWKKLAHRRRRELSREP